MKETIRSVGNVADELLWSLRSIVRKKESRTTGHCTYSLVAVERAGIRPRGIFMSKLNVHKSSSQYITKICHFKFHCQWREL